ncbi:craniofacial development protein 2-like [Phthorimaea operculella]|nr:craniofacial development protein 2-like [Phthorimaea operculella]
MEVETPYVGCKGFQLPSFETQANLSCARYTLLNIGRGSGDPPPYTGPVWRVMVQTFFLIIMTSTSKKWPQVPGGSSSNAGTRGAKNLRAATSSQTTQATVKTDSDLLNVLTYNVRTLISDERLLELEEALKYINWDIVGLSEVRRKGETTLERDDNIFFHYGETSGLYGIGFLVHKKWKDNIKEFIAYSERIAVLKFRVSDKKLLTIIQAYAPTSAHTDEEVEEFYVVLNRACDENKSAWRLLMGDFNAKVGIRQDSDNDAILGPHGLGLRNDRGIRLIQFAFGQNVKILNTYFPKKLHRRWTTEYIIVLGYRKFTPEQKPWLGIKRYLLSA